MDEVSFERNGSEIRMRKTAALSATPSLETTGTGD